MGKKSATDPSTLLRARSKPVQENGKRTMEHILTTAAGLLEKVGIDGFNTNVLAEAAGIRIRSVYRYFPNKLAIIAALARRMSDEWAEWLEPYFQRFEDQSCVEDWREILRTLLRAWVQKASRQPGGVAVTQAMEAVPELREIDREVFDRICERFGRALVKRGVALPSVRVRAIARVFTLSAHGGTDLYFSLDSSREAQEMWRELIEMLILNLERYINK
jgi:AcrR family transcriptional regulator